MAMYGINKEGADSLNQLANDLSSLNKDIEADGKKLKASVAALGDSLGIYEAEILALVDNVNKVQEKGSESIHKLSASIKKKASEVEELVNSGLG